MKLYPEIEVAEGFEPQYRGCEAECPFGFLDQDGEEVCYHINSTEPCPMKKALERHNTATQSMHENLDRAIAILSELEKGNV